MVEATEVEGSEGFFTRFEEGVEEVRCGRRAGPGVAGVAE